MPENRLGVLDTPLVQICPMSRVSQSVWLMQIDGFGTGEGDGIGPTVSIWQFRQQRKYQDLYSTAIRF
jgi:hypothetical protein